MHDGGDKDGLWVGGGAWLVSVLVPQCGTREGDAVTPAQLHLQHKPCKDVKTSSHNQWFWRIGAGFLTDIWSHWSNVKHWEASFQLLSRCFLWRKLGGHWEQCFWARGLIISYPWRKPCVLVRYFSCLPPSCTLVYECITMLLHTLTEMFERKLNYQMLQFAICYLLK